MPDFLKMCHLVIAAYFGPCVTSTDNSLNSDKRPPLCYRLLLLLLGTGHDALVKMRLVMFTNTAITLRDSRTFTRAFRIA